jgi:PAS domain S-box-containing protein
MAAVLLLPATFALFPRLLTNVLSSTYLPHGFCFLWNPRLLWLHVGSDSVITFSYIAIASTLAGLLVGLRRQSGFQSIVVLFSTFILARVRFRAQVREAEARLRAIVDNVIDGIITIDAAGSIASINPAGVRMFEYQPRELIGKNVKMLMPEPDRDNHDGHLARYQSTSKTRIIGIGRELDGLAKSGRTFPMELTITEVSVGSQRLFVGVVRDITERKRAEHDALKARAFRESLIENSPAAIIVTDVDFTISAMNPAAQKMLWYQPDELIGRGTPLIFYDHFPGRGSRQAPLR